MWHQENFFRKPVKTISAKYIGGSLLDLSGNNGEHLHLRELPTFIDDRVDIVGLSFGQNIHTYARPIESSWYGSEEYHERTTVDLLSYVASLYRHSSKETCEKLQEVWVPLSTSFISNSRESNKYCSDLRTIFTYAQHVCFVVYPAEQKEAVPFFTKTTTRPKSPTEIRLHLDNTEEDYNATSSTTKVHSEPLPKSPLDIVREAYRESWSTAEIHFETFDTKLSPNIDVMLTLLCAYLNTVRTLHRNIPSANNAHSNIELALPCSDLQYEQSLPYYFDMTRAPSDRWNAIAYKDTKYPLYISVTDELQRGMQEYYDFLRMSPKPGLVASDFDGTAYRENHEMRGYKNILYTNYLAVHCAYIITIAKEYLRKYPDTFPKFKPNWSHKNEPALIDQWFEEYKNNILEAEFAQEERYNNPKLTNGECITGGTNATKNTLFDMLATIWEGNLSMGPPKAYEEVFENHPELRDGAYSPVIDMLDAASRVFHNKTTIITLAFPDFVRWFLGKQGFHIPVMGNRTEVDKLNLVHTGKRDTSYFSQVPNYSEHNSHSFAVDEQGKANILEHYFHKTGLKPKVFFGNSDGDYEACRYTIKCGGKVVLVNPRGNRLPTLRRIYPDRVITLNFPAAV